MKIFFRTLAPVKKEVSKFRNTYIKIFNTKVNLSESQDIVAKMYGWQHYNEMSAAHDTISSEELDLLDYNQLREQDIHFINMMDTVSKSRLEIQKRSVILKFFKNHKSHFRNEDQFIISFFKKDTGFLEKLIKNIKQDSLSVFDIPSENWRLGTSIFNDNYDCLYRIYSTVPLLHALDRGGLFIIREELAFDIIKNIADALPENEQERLKVVDLNRSYKNSSYSHCIDIKSTETPRVVFDFVCSIIRNQDEESIWQTRAISLFNLYIKALENIYGTSRGTLKKVKLNKSLGLNNFVDFVRFEVKSEKLKETIFKELFSLLPLFDLEEYLNTGKFKQQTYENYAYLTMQFSEILKDIDFYHLGKLPSLNLTNSLASNDIIFILYKEKEITGRQLKGIFTLFRSSIAPLFGMPLHDNFVKGVREDTLIIETKRKNSFKPVVLDACDNYISKGMAIVMAQARGIGYSTFYHFKTPLRTNSFQPEEYASIMANTNSKIFIRDQYTQPDEMYKCGFVHPSIKNPDIYPKDIGEMTYSSMQAFMEQEVHGNNQQFIKMI